LAATGGDFHGLLAAAERDTTGGFRHTIREICQQPITWPDTASRLATFRGLISESLAGVERVVVTGSGSSQYAGECAAQALQKDLRLPVQVFGGGELLLRSRASVAGEPTLVVSLARSGDSPESAAVVEMLLENEPHTRHLVISCNSEGRLSREFSSHPRVRAISLSDQVNDRSLVMTSSFTNLVLSARFLGRAEEAQEFALKAEHLGKAARQLLIEWPDRLGDFVSGGIERIVFLGDGNRFGAARESALKLLEMTAGKVATMAETYLGLRHGPMSFINSRTLLVCYLSNDPLVRCYEKDLILELDEKKLGARKLVAGPDGPEMSSADGSNLAIKYDLPGSGVEDADLALLDVIVAQILGFHRCREEGLKPDSPSEDGVISRVVREFRIHTPEGATK